MHITLGFLNEVRCDILKNETPKTLEQRLIRTSVVEKFEELQSLGHSPVCLFHTRKACRLSSETIEIPCIAELDETFWVHLQVPNVSSNSSMQRISMVSALSLQAFLVWKSHTWE